MLDHHTRLMYYKREDVQEAILEAASNREIAVKFGDKGFGKRPDVLYHRRDVFEMVKQGATSFHCSEELWSNPLQIDTSMSRREMDELRAGWDLVLDIDCKWLEYSQIAADLLIKAIRHHDIECVSCKFSGNHGFHIAVPFQAFPELVEGKETRLLFPEGARKIAQYLGDFIRFPLAGRILEHEGGNINAIIEKTGKPYDELMSDQSFDPYSILDIDTILIASRHLYRMVYSFNEKSNMVSIPVKLDSVLEFDRESARPERVSIDPGLRYLDTSRVKPNEAARLIISAFDFCSKVPEEHWEKMYTCSSAENYKEDEVPQEAIPKEMFPPCIIKVMAGLEDGKKRSTFVLMNFLRSIGWSYADIDKLLHEWNGRNAEPMREVLIRGQLRYHKANKKRILPPNCDNEGYYKALQVCCPDNLCKKIKNPVNYSKIRAKMANEIANQAKRSPRANPDLTEEQKQFIEERRRKEREFRKQMKDVSKPGACQGSDANQK